MSIKLIKSHKSNILKSILGIFSVTLLAVSFNANAALYSRLAGQAYYDDVADLTWYATALGSTSYANYFAIVNEVNTLNVDGVTV